MMKLKLAGLAATFAFAAALAAGNAAAADFNWRFYSIVSPMHPYGKILTDGFKRIEEKSGGKLKIEFVAFSETPYKGSEAERVVRDGLGEMTEWLLAYSTSTYPLLSAAELPYLPTKRLDPAEQAETMDKVWSSPALADSLGKILKSSRAVRLGHFYYPPQNHWFNKPVTKVEDFKGLKIREYSAEGIDFTTALGAVPVSLTAPEVYTALQRGTLDGAVSASTSMTGLKWGEVLKTGFISNFKMSISLILVNERKYNQLPPEVRDVLRSELDRSTKEIMDFMVKNEPELLVQLTKDYNFTITTASDADYTAMRQVAKEKVWPNWVKRVGPEGQALVNDLLSTLGAPERM